MALDAHDINGSPFSVGDVVQVRGKVTAIVSASGNAGTNPSDNFGGSGDSVTVLVDVNGNAGEKTNVSFVVSPVQCRRAAGKSATGVSPV
jgi:hypothetical protein